MKKDTYIKALAQQLIEKTVDKKVAESILERLNKQDLKRLLFFLKKELTQKQVYVGSVEKLDTNTVRKLNEIFKGKEIVNTLETDLLAGIKIQDNDMIYDFSIKNKIKQTVNNLSQSL